MKAIAGKRLSQDDAAKIEGEVRDTREAAGLLVEMGELEDPAAGLPTGMLAGDAIEPALDAAGQPEISRIDRQHERAVDNAAIEPVRQDELHAFGPPVMGRAFFPLVDPGELVAAPMFAVPNGGADLQRRA